MSTRTGRFALGAFALLFVLVSGACGGGGGSRDPAGSGTRTTREPIASGRSLDQRECLSWGSGIAALVCNEVDLRVSLDEHRMTMPWKGVKLTTPGNQGRIGTAPGLAQVILHNGWPFEPGGTLVIRGKVPKGTILLVWARDRSHGARHPWEGQALFRDIGLEHGGKVMLTVSSDSSALVYTLTGPNGSRQPDMVWFKRF